DAPQNECAHQDLAQFSIGLHERQKVFASHLDDLSVFADANTRQRAAVGQRVNFAGELLGPEYRNKRFTTGPGTYGLQFTRKDNKTRNGFVPWPTRISPFRTLRRWP